MLVAWLRKQWKQTLTATNRSEARQPKLRPVRLWAEILEDRLAPTGNITLTNAFVVNQNDKPLTTVSAGQAVYIEADFTTQNLPSNASYGINFTVNGLTLEPANIGYGAGKSGTNSWYIYWGTFIATPGTNQVTVTVDPAQSVAETSYADNTMSFSFTAVAPAVATPSYTVAQIRSAYGINSIPNFGSVAADGSGQTIAIDMAGNAPKIISDLDGFDQGMSLTTNATPTLYQQYGPASSILTVYNQDGTDITADIGTSGSNGVPKAIDPGEITLDVEWAHAIAPGAKIDLIETDSWNTVATGDAVAAGLPGVSVVSNSWITGGPEQQPDFTTPSGHTGVTFLAATGDGGTPGGYPADLPNVVGVGGTQLSIDNNAYASETGWSFPAPRTLNDGSSSYTVTGSWTTQTGGFSNPYSVAPGGKTASASWTTSIASADIGWSGGVEVSATWTASPTNATNATYTIYDGTQASGTVLGTVSVDQTKAPVGTADGGSQFQELGDFVPSSGKVTVVLNAGSANGTVVADAIGIAPGWASGGGQTQQEPEPSYQLPFQNTGFRSIPDVSFDGSDYSGVTCYQNGGFGNDYFGTSLACPCWAGLIAIANQGLAAAGGTTLNSPADPTQTLQALYSLPASAFNDITTGYNGFSAGPGYDFVTGLGTPIANLLIPDLVNAVSASSSQSSVSVQSGVIQSGQSTTITLTAKNAAGFQETSGGLTVVFGLGSGTSGGTLGTVTDNGNGTYTATFTGTLAGTPRTITATIDGTPITSTLPAVTVQDGTTTSIAIAPNPGTYGNSETVTAAVSADDAGAGVPVGTVTFTEGASTLASNVAVDANGHASFNISTLGVGSHTITASFAGATGWLTSSGSNSTPLVVQDGTSTTVTVPTTPSTYGSSVTVTAAIKPANAGAGVPTGTVTFMQGSTTLASNVSVDGNGNASFSTAMLAAGSDTITASFTGSNGWINSGGSGTLTVNKADLTVTANPASRLYGAADPVFSAVLSGFVNGDTANAVSGNASITSNDTVTSPVGTYTITPALGTLTAANYAFTAFNSAALTVNKSHLTVTASAAGRLYGAADPAFAVTFSGFVNGDTSSVVSGQAGLTSNDSVASPVGAYTITPALGTLTATNYDFTLFDTGMLTINPAHLTVTANGASRHYGGADPTLGVTITGFKNGDTASVVSGQASLTSNATVTSPVGAYTITPALGTLSATNYDFTVFNTGVLTITKAYMTVTALPASRLYGAADPTFAVSFSGFLNGDTASVISGSASFTSTDTVTSPVANYTITPALGTLTATNYQFNAFHTGALTVTKAPLTVTANPVSRQYGAADPTFGVTITGFVNGDTSSVVSGHANISSNDTVTSPVGSYTITPTVGTLSATNYSFTMAAGALTVTQAPLTVTANSASRVYGAADPVFSVSFSGLQNGDMAGVVSGSASFTSTDTLTSPVGTYTITPALGTLTATNYAFAVFDTGVLTVLPGLTSSTANLPLNAVTITLNGEGFDTNQANDVVTFLNGVTGTVSGATSTQLTISNLTGLTQGLQLEASVSVDGFNSGTPVQVATVTAAQFGTAASVTAAPSPGLLGQAVTVTATVSATDARTGVPTGTVTFTEGTTTLAGNVAVNGSGQASFSISTLVLGNHGITASFTGSGGWQNSSGSGTEAILYGTSTSAVKAAAGNPANPFYGQALTFTASVANTSSSGGTPTGSVTFYNGTTALGTRTLVSGVVTITLTTLPVGTDQITATYLGAGNFAASSSPSALAQMVTKISTSTSTVMPASGNPANPTYGQTLTFTATVSNSSGIGGTPTGSVTFFNGTTSLGTKTLVSGAATITLTTLSGGTDAITATYLGAGNFGTSSSPTVLSQTVTPLATTTSVVASKTNPSSYAQAVALSATVSNPSSVGGVPAGSVTFFNGTTSLGSSNLVSGVATLSVTTLPVGADQITAAYAGSVDFLGSSSTSALAQTVNKIATSTGVVKASTSNPSSPVYGQSLTFTATVANTTGAGGVPTGSVTFYNGTTALGTRTLVSGVATLSLTALSAGTDTITATYLGAGNFAGSSSPSALTQTVAAASTSTAVTASPSPATVGQTVTLTATVSNAAGLGITPTGTVTFKDVVNGVTTTLGTRSLVNGVATFTTSTLPAGSYTIEAFFNLTTDFLASSGNVFETIT